MQQPYFSVIIPHRDIPELLERCLNSVPQRDDLEIIIVDDNSTATFVDFEHFSGKERSDTKIIFLKENKGGGGARNIGLDIARGEWILFADADDFFNPCVSEILDSYKNSDADLIFFNANSVDTESLKPMNRARHLNGYIDLYEKNPAAASEKLKYLFGEPWAKMVKKRLLDKYKIRFEETRIHNDTAFAYLIGYHAEKILVDKRVLYCITAREGSVSVSVDEEKILTRIQVLGRANKFYKEHNLSVRWTWLYSQMGDLFLFDRKLYFKALDYLKKDGVDIRDFKIRMLKTMPKRMIKYFVYKITGKKYI